MFQGTTASSGPVLDSPQFGLARVRLFIVVIPCTPNVNQLLKNNFILAVLCVLRVLCCRFAAGAPVCPMMFVFSVVGAPTFPRVALLCCWSASAGPAAYQSPGHSGRSNTVSESPGMWPVPVGAAHSVKTRIAEHTRASDLRLTGSAPRSSHDRGGPRVALVF